jgi:hypothetical protein
MVACWPIGDGMRAARSPAVQFARLRGVRVMHWRESGGVSGQLRDHTLLAIDTPCLLGLPEERKRHLASLVGEGAVLYVRGLPRHSTLLDLAPFAPARAAIAGERRAVSYRFTTSPMLPAVLAGEEVAGIFETPAAALPGAPVERLLMVRHVDGAERTAVFALEYGAGCVIYDLHPEDEADAEGGIPIVAQLAHPEIRHRAAGALVAADRAARREAAWRPAFNLIIDDRPANFDHFNTARLHALLSHIETLCPGAHTDFAWTPSYTHPARAYIETLREFAAGFVWHGLHRHVDHRAIADLAAELAQGQRLACRIEQRFGVRLQRVMIFPYERSTPEQLEFLRRSGFLASVEGPRSADGLGRHHCAFLACRQAARHDGSPGFARLHRYPVSVLTRDRMLAMAALGLPIITYAHPWDVRLRRFSRFRPRGGDVSYFDEVLRFAVAKGLRARALEEIAAEVGASHAEDGDA